MDRALGPPEKMVERREALTPMMSQYLDLCEQYDDALVLFQVGDFYEAFCEAAEVVARLLEITLTKREDSTGEYAMAGVPVEDAESYVETLLDEGYRVAVADQVEDPDEVSGVVDRAVTRVVTPGTLTEDELLDRTNTFVACLTAGDAAGASADSRGAPAGEPERDVGAAGDQRFGLAFMDVSTGEVIATSTADGAAVADEVTRFGPAEAIVEPGVDLDPFDADCMVTPYRAAAFDADAARDRVADYFGDPDALLAGGAEIRACGALLAYAEYTRGGASRGDADRADAGSDHLDYVNELHRYDPREYMVIDAVAAESLEIFERRGVHGTPDATLVSVVDETASAPGRRTLTDWLRRPLLDAEAIEARHGAVEALIGRPRVREELSDLLGSVYDLERLVSRVARGRADARDLRSLSDTLSTVPEIRDALDGVDDEQLTAIRDSLDGLPDLRARVDDAIKPNPPAELSEGDLIREGYDDRLDDLRATEREGKDWIEDLEARERERTGIDSLKVGYNEVHGYYIEVTNPNLDRVPGDYTRRQTLKNAERFYTPELNEREEEILRAERQADDLELELFRGVRDAVAAETERVQALASTLSDLDALVALAEVGATRDYVRPTVDADGVTIEGGRHPVVERAEDSFVPNDTDLSDDRRVEVITGPNMSGKSTYMRQVALIHILAQAGSFVPADRAALPLVDRVFTRVGASDDIAGGRSTFMVEMDELATILRTATADSLVLLDEVGRGTATTDGLAIATAATEYLHDDVGALTLFATHHHELTDVADRLPAAHNRRFEATRRGDEVTFDHEIREGAASSSYGVAVAALAGVPDEVVDRARAVLDDDRDATGPGSAEGAAGDRERPGDRDEVTGAGATGSDAAAGATDGGASADATGPASDLSAVAARIRAADLADTTPLEALDLLHDLQRDLD
ncbi:MAG: DNA mismatch repair protein MutS [Halobacteriaceae archaeon]